MKRLEKLFSPIKIGTMEIKNRMVMAPMATDYTNPDGTISQRLIDYQVARAKGGIGLITSEVTTIDSMSPYVPNTVALWDDKFIPGFKKLADAVHAHGAKIVPQISHPGPESLAPFFNGTQTVGPSPVMNFYSKLMCRELSIEEIEKIVEQYGETAQRAKEAGCDGMELHAAHSYMLVGSFLSPLRNKRSDIYGGSLTDRLKLPLDIIRRVKETTGNDFPIIMRLSGDYLFPGGIDLLETQYMTSIFAEAGIDAFHISAGVFPELSYNIMPPTGTPLGLNAGLSAAIKKVVDVPVMVVGRINDPRIAEDILQRDEADMVVMGRALLADPEFPNKAREGKFDDIVPCIACGMGCVVERIHGRDMTCVINPAVGKEKEFTLIPSKKPKKVMIAGAGPAGMKAASIAALRGHSVSLYEKEVKTGGQFNLAAVPPLKQELCKITRYLTIQAEKSGVDVQLNAEVTPELVEKVKPDVFVAATGGEPLVLDLPGIDGKRVVTAHDVLAGKVDILPGKVLIIGGGMVGCETAEYMYKKGDNPLIGNTDVTIIEMLDDVALDISVESRSLLLQRMRKDGIKIMSKTKVKEFLEDGVLIEKNGKEQTIRGIDRIVLSMGVRPVDNLSKNLNEKVDEVYVIGDAKQARNILAAIVEGDEVGRKI